jgi:hypothetical protein
MKKKIGSKKDESPAQLIDARIEELDDWRGEMLSRLRALIKQTDPEVVPPPAPSPGTILSSGRHPA